MDREPGTRPSVRRTAEWAVTLVLLATIALFGVAVWAPNNLNAATLVYLLLVAVIAIWFPIRLLILVHPAASDRAFVQELRRQERRAVRPEAVQALVRQLTFAGSSADDLHYRLRPMLREIAARRLATHRNIALDGQPDRAAAILGPLAWSLLRADRPPPVDRHTRGADAQTLAAVLTALEET